jgi:hypothetical protein
MPRKFYRRRISKPIKLADLVDAKARKWRFKLLARCSIIRSKWLEAAGEFVAAHVQPARLVRKQLRLAVDDASWANEMTYMGPNILERLQGLIPRGWVDELKVVQGEPMPEPLPPPTFLILPPKSPKMQAKAEKVADCLVDPDLAEAVRRATIARLRRLDASSKNAVDIEDKTDSTLSAGDDP